MAGGSSGDSDEIISGINVTPLVDVTLVLLVIFIVTAKHIVNPQALPMDLPKSASGEAQQSVFSVEMSAAGGFAVDAKRVSNEDALLPLAREAKARNPEMRAVIKADANVPHGRVVRVMDLLKQAGVVKVAFGVSPAQLAPPSTSAK